MQAPGPRDSSRLRAAQLRLRIDVLTVEAVTALGREGVRAVVLKGPAIAGWLYAEGESRPYIDCDLLVNPEQLEAAGAALGRLGLRRLVDETVAPAFAEPHAVSWGGRQDRGTVDLHWRIPGIAADPLLAWQLLSADTDRIAVARGEVEALGKPARALHLALHAIQSGREATKSMDDLVRGLAQADEAIWTGAAKLAAELEAMEPFACGLRLTPPGAALADRLGLPRNADTRWALAAQTPPAGAMRLHELAGTEGARAKLRWVATALVPPPAYIRALYPETRNSTRLLALTYIRRPLTALRAAPGAWRALRRARLQARQSRGSG